MQPIQNGQTELASAIYILKSGKFHADTDFNDMIYK